MPLTRPLLNVKKPVADREYRLAARGYERAIRLLYSGEIISRSKGV